LYVLDEPSIGLHPCDTGRLIVALEQLRDLGNTVLVVEHDEAVIRAADWVIEMGPGAGIAGGEILGAGELKDLGHLPTGSWLKEKREWVRTVPVAKEGPWLIMREVSERNLRGIDVKIPLGRMVALTGPSGSGKSTLAEDVISRSLVRKFSRSGETPGAHAGMEGAEWLTKVVLLDQSAIGKALAPIQQPTRDYSTLCVICIPSFRSRAREVTRRADSVSTCVVAVVSDVKARGGSKLKCIFYPMAG
jgi:excinuclease ABC subunit A